MFGLFDLFVDLFSRVARRIFGPQRGATQMQYRKHAPAQERQGSPAKERQIQRERRIAEFRQVANGRMRDDPERNEIRVVYSSDWYQGFQCEAKSYLGKDRLGYYQALKISPQHDEHSWINWHGPYKTRQEAEQRMHAAVASWERSDGEHWQHWEDQQISQWERDGCPTYRRDKETGNRYQACDLPRQQSNDNEREG